MIVKPWIYGQRKCPSCRWRPSPHCRECGGTGEVVDLHEADGGLGWVGHPACDAPAGDEGKLIAHREEIEVLGSAEDPDACYSYDDYAVVRLHEKYYVLNTSGCSCPSPTETWRIVHGPCESFADLDRTSRSPATDRPWRSEPDGHLIEALEAAAINLGCAAPVHEKGEER